jgi:hypothetical protein
MHGDHRQFSHPVLCGSVRSHVNRTPQYSPENQLTSSASMPQDHNMEIIQFYSDFKVWIESADVGTGKKQEI